MDENNIDYTKTLYQYLLGLQTGGMIALGKLQNPTSGKYEKNIKEAREIINILSMFKQKTMGNLDNNENKMLDSIISNLQMDYVAEITKEDDNNVQ